MDTDARCLRRRPERIGELDVRKIVDEAQPERVELGLRELCEGLVEAVEPGLPGLDGGGLAVQAIENAELVAGRALELPSVVICARSPSSWSPPCRFDMRWREGPTMLRPPHPPVRRAAGAA